MFLRDLCENLAEGAIHGVAQKRPLLISVSGSKSWQRERPSLEEGYYLFLIDLGTLLLWKAQEIVHQQL